MNGALVPASILTASDCIASIAPSSWALDWVVETEQSRIDKAVAFGISESRVARLVEWTSAKFDHGFGWPNFFTDLSTAREFLSEFVPDDSDARIIALCISTDDGVKLIDAIKSTDTRVGEAALVDVIRSASPPPLASRAIGSDILNTDAGGSFHSYLCNGLENHINAKFGLVPNSFGLYDEHEIARAAAQSIEADGSAEPGPWDAFRMLECERA